MVRYPDSEVGGGAATFLTGAGGEEWWVRYSGSGVGVGAATFFTGCVGGMMGVGVQVVGRAGAQQPFYWGRAWVA